MKPFVLRVLAFLVPHTLLVLFFLATAPPYQNGYLAALLDKELLFQSQPAPRIVLVGGSNLAFGLDGRRLQRELGVSIVNLGLHASLSSDFQLKQVENLADERGHNEGDIVVVALEYQHYDDFYGMGQFYRTLAMAAPSATRHMGPRDWKTVIDAGYVMAGESIRYYWDVKRHPWVVEAAGVYARSSIDRLGSVREEFLTKPGGGYSGFFQLKTSTTYADDMVRHLNAFADRMAGRGVRVVYMQPPIPQYQAARFRPQLAAIEKTLREQARFPVLNWPADTVYPNDWFLDTPYHLMQTGRDEHTRRVIELLKPLATEQKATLRSPTGS